MIEENYNLVLYKKLKEELFKIIVSKSDQLSYGTFETLSEAKQMAGVIEGVRQSLQALDRVMNEMEKEDI